MLNFGPRTTQRRFCFWFRQSDQLKLDSVPRSLAAWSPSLPTAGEPGRNPCTVTVKLSRAKQKRCRCHAALQGGCRCSLSCAHLRTWRSRLALFIWEWKAGLRQHIDLSCLTWRLGEAFGEGDHYWHGEGFWSVTYKATGEF